jgi:hypothetical protein
LDKIVTPRRPKVDGEGVTVNEVRHVVSLVDVPAIAYNLSALFGGQGLCRTRLLAGLPYGLRQRGALWMRVSEKGKSTIQLLA